MGDTEGLELVRGTGNVFRDFGDPYADVRQIKAILAARIVGVLDDERLSNRQAQARTGVDQAEFSRIRNAKLERFTIDRLMSIINRLGCQVKIRVELVTRADEPASHPATT